MEKKIISVKAIDVDLKTKQVKVAISQMETEDRDKDIFDPSAWDKTVKENGPKGSNEIWHLLDHTPKSFSALSKFSELGREGKYLSGVSRYKDSFAWREVAWPLYEAGDITQHSVGFETIKATDRNTKGVRIITEARLYEGSAVLWGAQPDTPTMSIVKSLMNLDDDRDITAAEKIDEILKKINKERNGYKEEDFSLLTIELKRLQALFNAKEVKKIFEPELISTQTEEPDLKTTLPEFVDCPSCLKYTKNTQADKGYIQCHKCNHVFVYGGNISLKL